MKTQIFLAVLIIIIVRELNSQDIIQTGYANAKTVTEEINFNDTTLTNKTYAHPSFDIHVGWGFVPGGHVGIRAWINDFSFELGYGAHWANFIGPTDPVTRYTFGTNWYFLDNSNFVLSGLLVYQYYTWLDAPKYERVLFSPNIGYINLDNGGLGTYIRLGLNFQVYDHEQRITCLKFYDTCINLDFGVAFTF